MSAQPCKECGRRPKAPGRHRCDTCQLRQAPIGDQIAAAERRRAMVPEELRVKRTKAIIAQAPVGTTWCAGCQSFRDLEDFNSGATRCRPCASAVAHAARIEKVYGLSAEGYEKLLKLQGGKCAICRARPKKKRLAVDHDHQTGAVLGLLCSRCNHDLKGSAWDSLAMATALWHYMNTPPATGEWLPPEAAPQLMAASGAVRPSPASDILSGLVTQVSGVKPRTVAKRAATTVECDTHHFLPVGSQSVPGKRGVWRVFVSDEEGTDAPF